MTTDTAPLTCEVCLNTQATQAMVMDYPHVGRHSLLVCGPCGDESEPEARRLGTVNRFDLVPFGELAAARERIAALEARVDDLYEALDGASIGVVVVEYNQASHQPDILPGLYTDLPAARAERDECRAKAASDGRRERYALAAVCPLEEAE